MTLSELITRVRSEINEPDTDGHFSDTEITAWLNEAQEDMAIRALHLQESYYVETTDGEKSYALPEDFIKEFSLYLNSTELKSINFNDPEHESAEEYGYTIYSEDIHITVNPGDGAYLNLHYYKTPDYMSDSTDVPEVPTQYQQFLIPYAVYRAYLKDERPDMAQMYYTRYIEGLTEMRKNYGEKPKLLTVKVERS